ncbi:diacylglycerol kinase family protein [uncultured Microbacterium sp.]|uniref:diacylglycerol/lipid kinase family protein n=1 Tax=uncultured Microbacterium sp. TaxID=191216 RepID=UPI0025E33501|nr:diacylglycerol kinase family protein [uncultured Microbacterium sp.]
MTDESTPPRVALVYNPIKVDAKHLRETVRAFATRANAPEPLFYETTTEDLGGGAAQQAIDAGAEAILVAGGDGTVRAVAVAVAGTDIPLTIVPSGTGNLLARNLNLPLQDPERMIQATFDGDTARVDVGAMKLTREDGTVDEDGFVVMAGIGLDAAMIANTSSQLKKTVGWVAYVDGAARALTGADPFRVTYQLDGHREHTSKVQSVLFANCGQLPAGIALIPDASIADGALDVAVIQPNGPLGWLGVWRKVWWDNSVLRRFRAGRRIIERRKDSSVRYLQGVGVDLAAESVQPVELDGDEFGEAKAIRVDIRAGALIVALPRGHDVSAL